MKRVYIMKNNTVLTQDTNDELAERLSAIYVLLGIRLPKYRANNDINDVIKTLHTNITAKYLARLKDINIDELNFLDLIVPYFKYYDYMGKTYDRGRVNISLQMEKFNSCIDECLDDIKSNIKFKNLISIYNDECMIKYNSLSKLTFTDSCLTYIKDNTKYNIKILLNIFDKENSRLFRSGVNEGIITIPNVDKVRYDQLIAYRTLGLHINNIEFPSMFVNKHKRSSELEFIFRTKTVPESLIKAILLRQLELSNTHVDKKGFFIHNKESYLLEYFYNLLLIYETKNIPLKDFLKTYTLIEQSSIDVLNEYMLNKITKGKDTPEDAIACIPTRGKYPIYLKEIDNYTGITIEKDGSGKAIDIESNIKNGSIKYYTNSNEPVLEANIINKIYHLSTKNLDGKTLTPRIPDNYFTKHGYEDNKTKRVSFAKSIDGSLMGIGQRMKGMKLYVHIPIGDFEIQNINKTQVPDCEITKEVWITSNVKVKCIGIIEVIDDAKEDGIPFKYGDKTAELYKWDWKWVKKINNESGKLFDGFVNNLFPEDIYKNVNIKMHLLTKQDVINTINDFNNIAENLKPILAKNILLKARDLNMGINIAAKWYSYIPKTKPLNETTILNEEFYSPGGESYEDRIETLRKKSKSANKGNPPLQYLRNLLSYHGSAGVPVNKEDRWYKRLLELDPDYIKHSNKLWNVNELTDVVKHGKCQQCGEIRLHTDDGIPCEQCGHDHVLFMNENYTTLWGNMLENTKIDIMNEAKKFPVQFDKDGNLLIKNPKKINFEEEYYSSHKLLETYKTENNHDGIVNELCKLWYMNNILERKIYDKLIKDNDKKDFIKIRAKILNDFNKYLKLLSKNNPTFNFMKYYNDSEYNDKEIEFSKHYVTGIKSIIKSIL